MLVSSLSDHGEKAAVTLPIAAGFRRNGEPTTVRRHVAPAGRRRVRPATLVEGDLARAREEWVHTNDVGARASSTIAGMHTRRSHGLLVASLEQPPGHHVFLSHVDATVTAPRQDGMPGVPNGPRGRPQWELAKHQFPATDPSTTPFWLHRFDQDPLPRWTYAVADGELEVAMALVRGTSAVVLRYAYRGPQALHLCLRPLIAARHVEKLQREHGGMTQRVELRPGSNGGPRPRGEMRVQPLRDLPRVCFLYEGTFVGSPDWWRRFEYLAERDRGLDFVEDLWTPGVFNVGLRDGDPVWLLAAVEELPRGDPRALMEAAHSALLTEDDT